MMVIIPKYGNVLATRALFARSNLLTNNIFPHAGQPAGVGAQEQSNVIWTIESFPVVSKSKRRSPLNLAKRPLLGMLQSDVTAIIIDGKSGNIQARVRRHMRVVKCRSRHQERLLPLT